MCKTTSGGTPSRSKPHYFEGTIPWIKSGELPDGIVVANSEYISDEAISNSSAKLLPAGTLLVALYGATVGKLGILSRPAATNQAVCAIFPSEAIDTKFLFWYLLAKRPWLIGQAAGGAQPNISQGVVRSLLVPVMPLAAQREIVAEIEKQFSRLDEAVANLQRVKANLKRYKASVLNDAVEGRLVEGDYQYEMVKLGSVANVVDPQPSHRTPPKQADGVPYIGIGDVLGNGKVDLQNSRKVAPTVLAEHRARYTLRMGDFIFGKIGTLGKPTLLLPPYNYTLSANVVLVQADGVRLLPEYALIFMESPKLVNMVNRDAKATTQAAYGIKRMRDLDIELPTIEVQLQITSEVDRRLSLLRRVESEVDINLKRAQALRQATLHKAFGPS